jgi:hypothetical protein
VIENARAGILSIFKRQSGFLVCGVMVEDDQIISLISPPRTGRRRILP